MSEFYPSLKSEKKSAYIDYRKMKVSKFKLMFVLGYASALSVKKSSLIGEFDVLVN